MRRNRAAKEPKAIVPEVTAKFFAERADALMKDLNLDCQVFVDQDIKRREKKETALASNEGKCLLATHSNQPCLTQFSF